MSVKIDDLNSEIMRILNEYGDDVEDAVKKTIDEDAKQTKDIVKSHAPARTGKYKKAITVRKEKSRKGQYKKIICVKKPYYRLSHLLEFPHLTRNGTTYTKAIPHFKYGDDYLKQNFESDVVKNIKKIK